jgi:hypothetical protein
MEISPVCWYIPPAEMHQDAAGPVRNMNSDTAGCYSEYVAEAWLSSQAPGETDELNTVALEFAEASRLGARYAAVKSDVEKSPAIQSESLELENCDERNTGPPCVKNGDH